jgi:hypothetical protein
VLGLFDRDSVQRQSAELAPVVDRVQSSIFSRRDLLKKTLNRADAGARDHQFATRSLRRRFERARTLRVSNAPRRAQFLAAEKLCDHEVKRRLFRLSMLFRESADIDRCRVQKS